MAHKHLTAGKLSVMLKWSVFQVGLPDLSFTVSTVYIILPLCIRVLRGDIRKTSKNTVSDHPKLQFSDTQSQNLIRDTPIYLRT